MLDVTYLSSRADDVMNELLEQQRYTDVAHHARLSSSSCSPLELSLNQKINEGVCIHFWQQITVTKVRNTQGSHCQHLDNIREAEACLIVEVIAIMIQFLCIYLGMFSVVFVLMLVPFSYSHFCLCEGQTTKEQV